jgi:hypothetical protein
VWWGLIKCTSVRLSPIRISTLIFPLCSGRISIAKTIHEMRICTLRISKSRHFCCCHRPCYRCYCQSLTTALQLSVLARNLSAEPSSNDHSNTKRRRRKNVVTAANLRKRYLHFLLQMISATTSLSFQCIMRHVEY